MFDLGKHAVFIWGAYGATIAVLAGLIAWIYADARHQRRLLAQLEAKGVRRRSAKKKPVRKQGVRTA